MDALRHPVEWIRDHPRTADWLLVLLLVAAVLPVTLTTEVEAGERELGGLGWLLLVGMNVPMAFRRLAPVAALWAGVGLTVPFWVLDYPDDPTGPSLLILIYSLAAHAGRPSSIKNFWAVLGVTTIVFLAGVFSPEDDLPLYALPANAVVFGTAWILGDNLRTRRQYLAELEEKATRAEERQAAEAARAVTEERARIARELHDVVAHSMSVMVVQAAAAHRVLDHDPAGAADALEAIETTGRESLTEMRRVLGVLRGDDESAELAPAPGLDELDRLLRQCEEAGLPVALEVVGEPRRLAPGLELSAYRVVQESLTNSLKHAGPAQASVRLEYLPHVLELEVVDDGRGAAGTTGGRGTGPSGQGLVGMRERVDAYGGTLETGPRPGGGFRVSARFPTEAAR